MKIIRILAAFTLTLFFLPLFGQEVDKIKPPDKLKKKEDFHLYLVVGGSNMLVKNTFKNPGSNADSKIFLFDIGNEWVSTRDHIKSSKGAEQEEGTGPTIFFAESMLVGTKDKNIMIGLVNCAEENSELADWIKGGKYYANAVEKMKLAMKTGAIKGILWHQANAEMEKANPLTYAEDVAKIAMDLRKDLNSPDFRPIPFVGGKLVSHPYFKEKDEFKKLNDTLQKKFNDTDRSGLVESRGLKDSGDGIRFAAESMSELGNRYANAMLYLEGKKR